MAAKAKASAEAAALQTIHDYLKSDAFFDAIECAVEKAVDKQLSKIIERLSKIEQDNLDIMDRLVHSDGKLLELETSLQTKETEISRLNGFLRQHESTFGNFKLALNDAEQYSRL